MPLTDLRPAQYEAVGQLAGGRAFAGRLASLGFTPGVALQVLQNLAHGPPPGPGARYARGPGPWRGGEDMGQYERSQLRLYLLSQLLSLPAPLVPALNMIDVPEQQGIRIEPRALEAALGRPVVPMVTTGNQGLKELTKAVCRMSRQGVSCDASIPRSGRTIRWCWLSSSDLSARLFRSPILRTGWPSSCWREMRRSPA